MSIETWTKSTLKSALVPVARASRRLRRDPGRVVLVLAHMRSGSSLLHHLLISNPALFGRGERNQAYRSTVDFDRLFVDVCATQRRWLPAGAHVCDQVNHGRFVVDETLLLNPRVRKILLVREPRPALASMVHVLGQHYGFGVEAALDHYVTRLRDLRRYAEHDDRRRQFVLTYDELVGPQRRDVLHALSAFLELPQPLDERYEIFDFTGRSGDPSARIRAGRITDEPSTWTLELPEQRARELQAEYEECVAVLRQSCSTA